MASNEAPNDRQYTKEHEWAKEEGSSVTIGITAFAVDQLGDITLVNLDVKPGDTLVAGNAFGTIESVKTLSDLFAPVSGVVERINTELEQKPELVNDDCYGKAWMIAVRPSDKAELAGLMDASGYIQFVKTAGH